MLAYSPYLDLRLHARYSSTTQECYASTMKNTQACHVARSLIFIYRTNFEYYSITCNCEGEPAALDFGPRMMTYRTFLSRLPLECCYILRTQTDAKACGLREKVMRCELTRWTYWPGASCQMQTLESPEETKKLGVLHLAIFSQRIILVAHLFAITVLLRSCSVLASAFADHCASPIVRMTRTRNGG